MKPQEIELMYMTYAKPIYSFLRSRIINRDSTLAEDLTHDTFLKAIRGADQFKSGNLQSWLFTIASRNLIDYFRLFGRNRLTVSEHYPDRDQYNNNNPLHLIAKYETIKLVRESVEELPSNYKEVIRMRYFHFLDIPEISKILRLNLSTTRVRLYRAKAKLEDLVKRRGLTPDI